MHAHDCGMIAGMSIRDGDPSEAPARAELLNRAKALVPALKERAALTEQRRQIPPETVAGLIDSELIRIGNPDRYGGLGVGYDLAFEVAWELGRACGASSWCYGLWAVHACIAGYWPRQAQEEFFAGGPAVLASSSFSPAGKTAAPVAGGYRVSGRWEFSSGCDASAWAELGVTTPEGPAWILVPRSDFEIVDNWFVSGLSGSGSKDILVHDAFVPSCRFVNFETAGWSDLTGWEIHGEGRYRVPLRCLLGWDLLAPLIGMVRGCIDEFVSHTAGRMGPSGRLADSSYMQVRLAESCAEIAACQALLLTDVREMLQRGEEGDRFAEIDRARYARDRAFITKLCLQAVNRLFEASGGHALLQSEPMQRLHRDAHAACHRETMLLDFAGQAFGRLALSGAAG